MTMAIDSKHPDYSEFIEDWEQLRDTYRGERIVKARGTRYLPMTSGMIADGGEVSADSAGAKAYRSYVKRAVFPEVVGEAVEAMLGVLHFKPPSIELPAKLEPMRERATLRGESLEMLLRRINQEQLITGRAGLLLDVPKNAPRAELPHVALYKAEHLINWDDGDEESGSPDSLNLVVIDESGNDRRDGFEWERVERFRVLVLGDLMENEQAGVSSYSCGVFEKEAKFSTDNLIEPMIRGKKMERIPFVFVNTKDIVPEPDDAPLIGLSNLALAIYRGEADYRQARFMQGQDTLVTIGATGGDGEGETRVGAGSELALPMGGDAKFIGVNSQGLPEMRLGLENDYKRGESKSQGLIEAVGRAAESGEALRVRVAARTASLNQLALAGAFALQELLRMAAEWVGANPEEVIVTPNQDFVSDSIDGRTLVDYMTAKGLGAPVSLQSIHEVMQARGLTEKTWEEELEQLAKEAEEGLPGAVAAGEDDTGSTNPDGPEDDSGMDPNEDPEAESDDGGEEDADQA